MNGNISIKSYETHLKRLEAERDILKREFKDKQSEYDKKGKQITEIKDKITKLKGNGLSVSEHALLRFIERAMGFDLELIKSNILTEELRKQHSSLGNGNYPIHEGLTAVIKNNVIVTIK